VLETGIALNSLNTRERPLGGETYTITPQGRSGNYFQTTEGTIERVQAVANVVAPAWTWKGQHRIKFGIDANRIRFRQFTHRRSFQVERLKGSLARLVDFSGNPSYGRDSSEFSAFGQDRWSLNDSTLVEAGMRLDWDQILRQPLVSPRLAVTWGLRRFPESKFTAGIGIFYDAINLGMVTRAMDQQRSDTFFAEDGQTIREGPILSRYVADERILKAPYYLNWSLGWEQRLPRDFYFRTSFIRKHGRNGWSYDLVPVSAESPSAVHSFELGNVRRDSFRYLEFTVTRTFAQKYNWLVSYARSSARSSAVIDYSLENPIFGRQGSGPLDWDIPNRLISWGLLPTPLKKYTVAYFLEWHSGFPFSVVNDTQQLVGSPNSHRFPEYFSLNVHFERRFRFWRHQWALRAGFNNITSHENATVVNNNIAAAEFGEFGGGQGRVFTGRIRFLGKN
jgi:outer membrane receptor for ferrienterochelin and colicin